jgi:hypothetical protein
VSGLALLTGATALVAVAGGHRSLYATLLLGLLAAVMAHALVVEIQRQARRRTRAWGRHDTVNTVLLACWAVLASVLIGIGSRHVQILGFVLAPGYAAASAYFVVERLRVLAAPAAAAPAVPVPAPAPAVDPVVAPSPVESTPSV